MVVTRDTMPQPATRRHPWIAWLAAACVLVGPYAMAGRFKSDDPLPVDPDTIAIPMPTDRPLSKTVDLLQKSFRPPLAGSAAAGNVNTVDEVPDSSWFTNRMSNRWMTADELARGPNQIGGPVMTEPWLIVKAKTEGITPGFRIRDAGGEVYFVKFDPAGWPQLATSAEVIGTKFFHAMGYNTPENYLVRWRPVIQVDKKATIEWASGLAEPISPGFVRAILSRVPRRTDGTIQVMASRRLPGKPIGPFDYQGLRPDDPNDIIPHEDRRELRALRVFTSWLNHNDSDAVNSLDIYRTNDAGGHVEHYLIDFGTVLGSGATGPHARRVGNEYYIDLKSSLRAGLTFGIWDRSWRHVPYEMLPAVGRFESTFYQPEQWLPDYPNPAHDRMTAADALWATRIVMRFDDARIRAIVATGQLDDPDAADLLVRILAERRDKIVAHYLRFLPPLTDFAVDGRRLEFANLGVAAGLARDCRYAYTWSTFDNDSGQTQPIGSAGDTTAPIVDLPTDGSPFLRLRLTANCEDGPEAWQQPVDVFIRNGAAPSVVGIERTGGDAPVR